MLTPQPKKQYKWANPNDWFRSHINKLEARSDCERLAGIIWILLTAIDDEEIQELFQEEMDQDGYFDAIDKIEGDENEDGVVDLDKPAWDVVEEGLTPEQQEEGEQ